MSVYKCCIKGLFIFLFLNTLSVQGGPIEGVLSQFIPSKVLTKDIIGQVFMRSSDFKVALQPDKEKEMQNMLNVNLVMFFRKNVGVSYPSFLTVFNSLEHILRYNPVQCLQLFYEEVGSEIGFLINLCAATIYGVVDSNKKDFALMADIENAIGYKIIIESIMESIQNYVVLKLLELRQEQSNFDLSSFRGGSLNLVVDNFNNCAISAKTLTQLLDYEEGGRYMSEFERIFQMIISLVKARMYDLPNQKGRVWIDLSLWKSNEEQSPLPWEKCILSWGECIGANPMHTFKRLFKCYVGVDTIKKSFEYWNTSTNKSLAMIGCTKDTALKLRMAIIVKYVSSFFEALLHGEPNAKVLGVSILKNQKLMDDLNEWYSLFTLNKSKTLECLNPCPEKEVSFASKCEEFVKYLYERNIDYDPRKFLKFLSDAQLACHDVQLERSNTFPGTNGILNNWILISQYFNSITSDQENLFTQWLYYTQDENKQYFHFEMVIRALPIIKNIDVPKNVDSGTYINCMRRLATLFELVVIILTMSDDNKRALDDRFSESLLRQEYFNKLIEQYGHRMYE